MIKILPLFVCCVFCGCFFKHTVKTLPDTPEETLIAEGRVLNSESFKKGRNFLIIPFKAGVGAEANENLHRISLLIIRGVSDVFQREGAPLNVLDADNADQADLVMKGYITQRMTSGRVKRWVLRKNEIFVSVEGKIIDPVSGETVLVFSHQRRANLKKEKEEDLAKKIGEDLGLFLIRQLKN